MVKKTAHDSRRWKVVRLELRTTGAPRNLLGLCFCIMVQVAPDSVTLARVLSFLELQSNSVNVGVGEYLKQL